MASLNGSDDSQAVVRSDEQVDSSVPLDEGLTDYGM
jgi:hypothetical protein